MGRVRLLRYDEDLAFTSPRDSLSDLVDQLTFCTSTEFSSDLLTQIHSVGTKDAKKRAKRLAVHVRTALSFVDQALSSRPDVASVAAYYAILNFSKCYLLASPLHTKLDSKLSHGASYHTYSKDSHTLLTESIKLLPKGVIPSLYEVITGEIAPVTMLTMREVYKFILDIGSEWHIATKSHSSVASAHFQCDAAPSGGRIVKATVDTPDACPVSLQSLRAFKSLKGVSGSNNEFVSRPDTHSLSDEAAVAGVLRRHLIYDGNFGHSIMPVCGKKLQMPQELPIILAFYHLSSISRYNPEFMARIQDSRYWPLVVSLQWHALQKYLVLTWSFLQRKNVLVNVDREWF